MEEESLSTLYQLIQAQLTYLARERDRGTGWTAREGTQTLGKGEIGREVFREREVRREVNRKNFPVHVTGKSFL